MKPVRVPAFVPPLTPIGYYAVHEVEGYSYKRKIGTRLVKRKGKSRRVRVTVYKTITVETRRVRVWIVQFPVLRERWLNVADYQQGIEDARELEGFEVTERDMELFHSSPAGDVIHTTEEFRDGKSFYFGEPTLFVWKTKKLPTHLKVFGRKRPFRMVRVWFWIYHNDLEEYRIWCRSSTIFESDFAESWAFAQTLYAKIAEDIGEAFDYLEVHGMIAWTAYTLGERAKRHDKRAIEKKLGGAA